MGELWVMMKVWTCLREFFRVTRNEEWKTKTSLNFFIAEPWKKIPSQKKKFLQPSSLSLLEDWRFFAEIHLKLFMCVCVCVCVCVRKRERDWVCLYRDAVLLLYGGKRSGFFLYFKFKRISLSFFKPTDLCTREVW